ncbi:hypothetical protein CDAR_427371 [Caerostris darwini]|uniref:Uncharacterized protein n=1 Tax=Caerostris darwini TaxID=1538125 RepID=A0AAV4PLP9_9ARAC|nr:hypothetical protein CDAR_427371 [Caerostris darwini]
MLPQRGNHPTAQGFESLRDFAKQQHRRVNHRDLINGEFLHCCLPPAQFSTPPCHRSLPFPAPKGPCYHSNSPGEPVRYLDLLKQLCRYSRRVSSAPTPAYMMSSGTNTHYRMKFRRIEP